MKVSTVSNRISVSRENVNHRFYFGSRFNRRVEDTSPEERLCVRTGSERRSPLAPPPRTIPRGDPQRGNPITRGSSEESYLVATSTQCALPTTLFLVIYFHFPTTTKIIRNFVFVCSAFSVPLQNPALHSRGIHQRQQQRQQQQYNLCFVSHIPFPTNKDQRESVASGSCLLLYHTCPAPPPRCYLQSPAVQTPQDGGNALPDANVNPGVLRPLGRVCSLTVVPLRRGPIV